MGFKTLYFIRHGETDMNVERRCQGRIDAPLNEKGREQSAHAAEGFFSIEIDRLYTSPLSRASYAAELIAAAKGLRAEPLEWLLEIDHGMLEGMDQRECEEHQPGLFAQWLEKPDTVVFPGGESLADMQHRVATGLWECWRRDEGVIVFVTHQVVAAVARCILQGRPLSEAWEQKLDNGMHLKLEIDEVMIGRLERAVREARAASGGLEVENTKEAVK